MAKFEVYRESAGEFRFRLRASNGQVIAIGGSYKPKARRPERHRFHQTQRLRRRHRRPLLLTITVARR